MIFGQLSSVAVLFARFHAGTRKWLSDCWPPLLEQPIKYCLIVGSMEAPSKAFLLFFLLPDWLKLSHLKSRMECGFSDIFRAIFVPP